MNLNEAVLNRGKRGKTRGMERNRIPLMGPPVSRAPSNQRNLSTSSSSELRWGKSHVSVNINSSSNRKSTSSKSTTDIEEDKIILALTEGRGEARCEVGIAAINVSNPFLVLCQTSDSQSYVNTLTQINIFNPNVIIYPSTFKTGKGNRLIELIRKHFPEKKLIAFARQAFNKANGQDKLYKIGLNTSFPLLMMIKSRYYALAAASGLLTYLQDNLYIYYASNSIKIEYQASEGYAIIDISTADRLELVCSNQPAQANKYSSLFGIMNRCLTRVGSRHLRSIVLQPLYTIQKIDERLDCVEDLIKHPDVLLSMQGLLPKLSSIDQLLSISTLVPEDPQRCTNRQINYLLLVNSVMDAIQPLKEIFKKSTQPFFIQLRNLLADSEFDDIKKYVRETIYEDAYPAKGQQAEQQRIWAIKPGLNGLLDLVRKTYSERVEDMREYVRRLGVKYDLVLTLGNNNKKGYHIVLALNQIQRRHMKSTDLPEEFIQVFRLATAFTMKTAELQNLSIRIDDILTDLFTLSNLMVHEIIVKVKPYAALFYRLVEGISYLDVLQSLAEASCANGWVRPKFDEYTDVTFGRHPLLDFLCPTKPVSNPVACCEHYNLHIITGPNGAGKSIFIRQTMLLQIMAQAGCFVPAQTAIFKPADKMFARISNEDDMECSASSFVLEMTEVNYILTTMTSRSLIIIDELCRSTSLEEGTAIAMAICEDLALSGAYTYVTTHFTLLTKLADLFVNIKVWQMQTIPSGNPNNPKSIKLDYKFTLIPGVTTLRGYGIYMTRNIWPAKVLEHVDDFQSQLTKTTNDLTFPNIDKRVRLKYDLECKLKKLKLRKKLTITNLNKHINDYNSEMANLGETLQNSQVVVPDLHCTMDEENREMDHSVFNTSKNMVYECPESENSKIYLDNMENYEENNTFHSVAQSELSSISLEPEEFNRPEVVLSPPSIYNSLQNPVSSPPKAKRRIREIFGPDTIDKNFQSQSSYRSVDSNQYFGMFVPKVSFSNSPSECSLNFTNKALNLEEDEYHSQITYNIEASQINQAQEDFYERQRQAHPVHNSSKALFKGTKNITGPIVSYEDSEISSCDLSQQLEMIRNERMNLTTTQEPLHYAPPDLSSELNTRNSEMESPFVSTFVPPLQSDTTKTSTPLITKIKYNARDFGSSSTSIRTFDNKIRVTTPKIDFTILNNVPGIDLQSIQEDLESIVEDMQNEDIGFFSEEEDVTSCGRQEKNNETNSSEDNGKGETFEEHRERNNDVTSAFKNTDSEQNIRKKVEQDRMPHFFPVVTIIEGPNDPSSAEDNNSPIADLETVVRPTVRNLQSSNQKEVDVLIKAFNSLSEPKNPILPQNREYNAMNEEIIDKNQTGCDSDNLNRCSPITKGTLDQAREKEGNNIDELIKAFNSLSDSKKHEHNRNKTTSNAMINDELHLSENKMTRREGDKIKTPKNSNDEQFSDFNNHSPGLKNDDLNQNATTIRSPESHAEKSSINYYRIEKPNYSDRLNQTEENSADCYESAISSPDISYSPLTTQKEMSNISNDINKLTANELASQSQESVYHDMKDCEKESGNVTDKNKAFKESIMKDIKRVEEVIELSDEEIVDFKNNCEIVMKTTDITVEGRHNAFITIDITDNNNILSSVDHPVLKSELQETREYSVTDYKSTEIFPYYGSDSIEQEAYETEKVTPNITVRKSNFYSNLSAESDNSWRSSHENIEKPVKDLTSNLSVADNNTGILGTGNKNPTVESDNVSCRPNVRPLENLTSNSIMTNNNTVKPQKEYDNNKIFSYLPTDSDSQIDEKNSNFNLIYSAINDVNEEELSTVNASPNYVCAPDEVHKIDDALRRKTSTIEKCNEAVEKEVLKQIKQMEDKNVRNVKDEETKLNQDKSTQYIPHLSAYSSSSSSKSEIQSKSFSPDYCTTNLMSDTKKKCSRTRTLGIARYRHGSKHIHPTKIKRRNSAQTITGKEKRAPNKFYQANDVNVDKHIIDAKLPQNTSEMIQKDTHEPEDAIPIADIKLNNNKDERSSGNKRQGIKRREPPQRAAESTPILGHTTQSKVADEQTITSISETSKLRNLDGDFTSSSSDVKKCCLDKALRNLTDYDEIASDQDQSVTSISDASRKRNLDQCINSSTDKRQSQKYFENSNETSTDLNITKTTNENKQKKMKRLGKPRVMQKSFSNATSSSSKIDATTTQNLQSNLKFISPLKLSKKAIKEAFFEQDKKFFETRGDATDLTKIWERRLRRPTVQQIQRSTCLATIRKTEEGVEVIPEKEKKKRKKITSKGKILSSTNSSVNMNMFSDTNADTFDQFIKSDKKDFKSFNFNFGHREASASRNDGKLFNFQQANAVSAEYVQGRNRSEELFPLSGYSNTNFPFLTQNADFTLTPDGYYKHHRDDIEQIMIISSRLLSLFFS